ncbi:hypothetical protein BU16DRAFT_554295 [Lophium mytilinum]|uniref:Uncharacterized protein n=1 Tax=Lophium mytilinum TaxID=390894 RepID=A0A6A6REQ7_9PEZI|nr:hypothetical protein BU16DRAFT_554295 [Lophium mytilinum]
MQPLHLEDMRRTPPGPPDQANGYTILAYAEHRDLWFAYQLKQMGVQSYHPHGHSPYSDTSSVDCRQMMGKFYFPPLLHAVYRRFWGFSLFLLRYDHVASLMEKTSPYTTVLDQAMSIDFVNSLEEAAIFPVSLEKQADIMPLWNPNDKFAQVSSLYDRRGSEGGGELLKRACKDVQSAWQCLLDIFPEAENSPIGVWFGIPYRKLSILEQSMRLHADFRSLLYALSLQGFLLPFTHWEIIVPTSYKGFETLGATLDTFSNNKKRRSGFPKQSLLEFFQGSPLDLMTIRGMRKSNLFNHGWSVSIRHAFISGGIAAGFWLALTIYTWVKLPFFWFWYIPKLVTVAILIALVSMFATYFALCWISCLSTTEAVGLALGAAQIIAQFQPCLSLYDQNTWKNFDADIQYFVLSLDREKYKLDQLKEIVLHSKRCRTDN